MLVHSRELLPSPLINEFLNYVHDSIEEDSRKPLHVLIPEYEYIPPENTKFL